MMNIQMEEMMIKIEELSGCLEQDVSILNWLLSKAKDLLILSHRKVGKNYEERVCLLWVIL